MHIPYSFTQQNARCYLSVVCHSTEELEFKIEPSWIFVEQPPQTAGQVLSTTQRLTLSDNSMHFSIETRTVKLFFPANYTNTYSDYKSTGTLHVVVLVQQWSTSFQVQVKTDWQSTFILTANKLTISNRQSRTCLIVWLSSAWDGGPGGGRSNGCSEVEQLCCCPSPSTPV